MNAKRVWWWRLLGMGAPLAVAPLLVAWIQSDTEIEENMRGIRSLLTWFSSGALAWIWTMVMVAPGWKSRLAVFCLPLVSMGSFFGLFRMAGSDGNGIPHFTWRWTPQPDESLARLESQTSGRLPAAPEGAQDFPRFLGPLGNNRFDGVTLDRDWKNKPPRELWRIDLGAGWGGFAVKGGLAITQEQRGQDECITAYALADGAPFWFHSRPVRFTEGQGGDGPRATPSIVDNRVYAMGATGWLSCLDLKDGHLIWERDVLANPSARNLMWGKSCSPLVVDQRVFVTGGERTNPSVFAFDALTGQPLWSSGVPGDGASYASLVFAKLAGRSVILSVNASSLTIHDASTGEILATQPWEGNWPKCSDPMVLPGDRILLTAGYQMGDLMLQARADGNALGLEVVWQAKSMKTTFNNCTIRDTAVYGIDDGMLACIDLKDGKRLWKTERVGHGQAMGVGDLLLVQTEPGPILLVEASPAGSKVLGKIKALEGKTWNNLCLAGKYLLARNDRQAFCFELPLLSLAEKR